MEPEQFLALRHDAVHELMQKNELCEKEFHVSSWPHWDYDLERGTLTFSENGVPRVLALIHVVGTTSVSGGTWMWSWANESLPPNVTTKVEDVREFGAAENIPELTEAERPDDEYLGWALTAVAAKLLGSKGAYRCPGANGFVYVVYSSIGLVASDEDTTSQPKRVQCSDHGTGFSTYVCDHLASHPAQEWFSRAPDEEHEWPDAWCAICDVAFQEEGEWNEKNETKLKIKLLCHHCYERLRSQAKH